MTKLTPAEWRALASRVEREEPTDELHHLIKVTFYNWHHPDRPIMAMANTDRTRGPLMSLDAAVALIPEGQLIGRVHSEWHKHRHPELRYKMSVYSDHGELVAKAYTATESRARTALACRVMAAMAEADHG